MNTKDFKAISKHLNIEPIEVIEPYNPQIVKFENVDDFNIYYSTHKEEFNNMTTQKLNTKYKIPGYRLTKKATRSLSDGNDENNLKLIKDYYKRKDENIKTDTLGVNDYKVLLNRITLLEKQVENISAFLSNM